MIPEFNGFWHWLGWFVMIVGTLHAVGSAIANTIGRDKE